MIENERKFVLKLLPSIENKLIVTADKVLDIEQGYLARGGNLTVRLRKQRSTKKLSYILTVKTRLKSGRVIEIEKSISEFDFKEMTEQAAGWLKKVRYVINGWEIDFFKDPLGKTYFIMAEIELPDGVENPKKIHPFVYEHLLYVVPKDDFRFSSKKLSDIHYAEQLLESII